MRRKKAKHVRRRPSQRRVGEAGWRNGEVRDVKKKWSAARIIKAGMKSV